MLVANAAAGGAGAVRRSGQVREMWSYRDLFLLGAAFLLMETKSVTGFALLFGTTWVVNALVFGGVLLAVLAAVELTHRVRTPPLRRHVRRPARRAGPELAGAGLAGCSRSSWCRAGWSRS